MTTINLNPTRRALPLERGDPDRRRAGIQLRIAKLLWPIKQELGLPPVITSDEITHASTTLRELRALRKNPVELRKRQDIEWRRRDLPIEVRQLRSVGSTPSAPSAPARTKPKTVAAMTRDMAELPIKVDNNLAKYHPTTWRSLGEFAQRVHEASLYPAKADPRLRAAATTFGSETVGADGGFAVPPDLQTDMVRVAVSPAGLLSRTQRHETEANRLPMAVDESTPWGSGGVVWTWEGEGDPAAERKPQLKRANLPLHKMVAFVPVTDELLEDTPALSSYLRAKAATALDYAITEAIVRGTGAGQPMGILNAPATISVAKEGSQTADTITGPNIVKMFARCWGPARRSAVWLVNQDAEVQVMTATKIGRLDTGADDTGWGVPIYTPPASESEVGLLLGRPIIPTQACSTLGDQGDIILAGLSEYMTATKLEGMRTDISIHFYFDAAQTAFRMTFRLGGAPLWSAPISGRDGASATLSPWVVLDERA